MIPSLRHFFGGGTPSPPSSSLLLSFFLSFDFLNKRDITCCIQTCHSIYKDIVSGPSSCVVPRGFRCLRSDIPSVIIQSDDEKSSPLLQFISLCQISIRSDDSPNILNQWIKLINQSKFIKSLRFLFFLSSGEEFLCAQNFIEILKKIPSIHSLDFALAEGGNQSFISSSAFLGHLMTAAQENSQLFSDAFRRLSSLTLRVLFDENESHRSVNFPLGKGWTEFFALFPQMRDLTIIGETSPRSLMSSLSASIGGFSCLHKMTLMSCLNANELFTLLKNTNTLRDLICIWREDEGKDDEKTDGIMNSELSDDHPCSLYHLSLSLMFINFSLLSTPHRQFFRKIRNLHSLKMKFTKCKMLLPNKINLSHISFPSLHTLELDNPKKDFEFLECFFSPDSVPSVPFPFLRELSLQQSQCDIFGIKGKDENFTISVPSFPSLSSFHMSLDDLMSSLHGAVFSSVLNSLSPQNTLRNLKFHEEHWWGTKDHDIVLKPLLSFLSNGGSSLHCLHLQWSVGEMPNEISPIEPRVFSALKSFGGKRTLREMKIQFGKKLSFEAFKTLCELSTDMVSIRNFQILGLLSADLSDIFPHLNHFGNKENLRILKIEINGKIIPTKWENFKLWRAFSSVFLREGAFPKLEYLSLFANSYDKCTKEFIAEGTWRLEQKRAWSFNAK